jgi:hypothetical protein
MIWLSSVHTALSGSQNNSSNRAGKLKAGQAASLEYVVRDDITARPESMARPPLLSLATDGDLKHSQIKVS